MRDSSRTPTRTRRRMRALPSKRRLGSFSSRVKSELRCKSEICGRCVHVSAANARRECLPGSTTDLGEGELDAPHLALVAQTILADELKLSVPVPPLTRCPRRKRRQARAQWPWDVNTYRRADSKGRRGTLYVFE